MNKDIRILIIIFLFAIIIGSLALHVSLAREGFNDGTNTDNITDTSSNTGISASTYSAGSAGYNNTDIPVMNNMAMN